LLLTKLFTEVSYLFVRLLELDLSSPLHFDQFEELLCPFNIVIAGEYLSCLPSELLVLFYGLQGRSQFVILALGDL
jgi:hypothetical protein